MKDLRPIAAALASIGFLTLPHAASADSLKALCGSTSASGTVYGCGTETLDGPCSIEVAAGQDLSINICYLNANGYPVTIKGSGDSRLTLSSNGAIYNASKIEIKFEDGDGTNCGQAVNIYDWRLEADDKVEIKAEGGISTGTCAYGPITAGDKVSVKSENGDVCVDIGHVGAIEAEKLEFKSDEGTASIDRCF